jgi:hypothetical protein
MRGRARLLRRLSGHWWRLTALERLLFYIGWPTGLGLVVVGAVGDCTGWWDQHPYFLELTGGLTAFMIGIPVAVAVLSRVQTAAEERARELTTLGRGHRAAQRLTGMLLDAYWRTTVPEEVREALLEGHLDEHRLDRFRASMRIHQLSPPVDAAIEEALRTMTSHLHVHDTMTSLIQDIGGNIAFPNPDLPGFGEVFFRHTVPSLTNLEALSIARESIARHETWEALSEHFLLPYRIVDSPWEDERPQFEEAQSDLPNLQRFYRNLDLMVGFLHGVLAFTHDAMQPPGRTKSR